MPRLEPSEVIEQLDTLIAVDAEMRSRSRHDDLSDLPDFESDELANRLYAAVFRLAPASSSYVEQAKAAPDTTHLRIPRLLGIVRAMKADVSAGWLTTVEELLHADTFADLLSQASELSTKGYKDPAAVVAGSVLETHLRMLCAKFGVPPTQTNGLPKKATLMNADLVKAAAYNSIQHKVIESWLAIRNAAAHGECDRYDAIGVSNMMTGIESFISANPA
jgi:hypothetical protein